MFNSYIYQPILSSLIFIYQNLSFHDIGIAIILLTSAVRIVLFPLFYKGAKDQTLTQKLQPKIKEIQELHKDDKEKQAKEMLAIYKEHKLNPFSGLFLLILQIPIFIALFRIFTRELSNPIFIDKGMFLGLINLSDKSLIFTVVAAALQYVQMKLSTPKTSGATKDGAGKQAEMMQKMMVVMGPGLTLVVLFNLPAALGLYWIVSSLFSVGQQIYINKKINLPR